MAIDIDSDREVDHLYEVPREDFVAARNALAREVRDRDQEAARRVKKLRKPTVAAWAVNQVARRDPAAVETLLEAGAAVERAQQAVLTGDDPDDLRARIDERRSAVQRLADEAVELASEDHRDDITSTLEAASVDEALGDLLRRGRLTEPAQPQAGIGDLAAMLRSGGAPPRRTRTDAKERRRIERRLARAESSLERSQERLTRARRGLADAERDAADARAAVERDREERDAIADELGAV